MASVSPASNSIDLPGYTVIREIGRGGMATVYLAQQESLQRHVALKVMNQEFSGDKDFRSRFMREAQVSARLSHPQIVTVHDFGIAGDLFFLSMEYLAGGTLKENIARGITHTHAVEILIPVARALGHAHRQQVVHRDVKPQNILLRGDGSPVLTDFGIARLLSVDTQLTAPGLTVGSPRYMSPEQVLGHTLDGRSDLFSLGIVFYEILTGEVPWTDTDNPISVAIRRCSEPIPTLPEALHKYQPLIDRLVAKAPGDRYPDADSFADELLRLEKQEHPFSDSVVTVLVGPSYSGGQASQQTSQGARHRVRKVLIGTAGAIAAAGLAWSVYISLIYRSPREAGNAALTLDLPVMVTERPIASLYEKLAIEQLRNRQYDQSLQTIGAGLTSAPADARLLALEDIVKKRQLVAKHTEAAERYAEQDLLEAGSREVEEGLALAPHDTRLLALRAEFQAKRQQRNQHEAARLLTEAKERFQSGDLDGSLARIAEGLKLVKNQSGLLSLRGGVEEAIERRNQASDLLEKARALEATQGWDESLALVNKGLKLDPENADLKAAKQRIEARLQAQRVAAADRSLAEASADLKAGELNRSLAAVEKGLQSVPDHAALLQLRQQVQDAIERERKAKDLLAKATEKANAGDLDASRQLIVEGLQIAPDQKGLLALQAQVDAQLRHRSEQQADQIVIQAMALGKKGAFDQALNLISEGLKLAPDNGKLLDLQHRLRSQSAEHERRETQAKVLVVRAHQALATDDLEAAFQAVQQALALVPDQPDGLSLQAVIQERIAAIKSKEQQADELQRQAKMALDEGRLDDGNTLIKKGLMLVPTQAGLLVLKKELAQLIAEAHKRRQQVDGLIAQARRKEREGNPAAAASLAEQALEIAPNDPDLIKLVGTFRAEAEKSRASAESSQKRTSDLLKQARQEQQSGHSQEALALVHEGLKLAPNHKGLLSLKSDINKHIGTEAKIANLLTQCEGHLRAGRLTTGDTGTAFDCYREVLALDPGNETALSGLKQIADKYASWAAADLDKDNLSAAKTHLERLQTVNPRDPRVASLEKRTERLQREQKKKQAARRHRRPNRREAEVMPRIERKPNADLGKKPTGKEKTPPSKSHPSTSKPHAQPRVWGTF